ncbi:hypothetical protein PAQ31011_04162 [Pandoraea aquatica]|uniref:Uncharacterized protein n=1 Tax=Pandoraea aquatica TaxID=2508290 RepID=A0A5E4XXR3_9BURK|nr:hypothetical protein [Pandoraea aquatica]VVE40845.1 hypothetical protein PAQ31011_04162 [Pandoraea aquatica]
MSELQPTQSPLLKQYLERVDALFRDATQWCQRRWLEVEVRPHSLNEEREGEYEVPSLRISRDGTLLGKLIPKASDVIAGDGLVTLIGAVNFHHLVFYGEYDPGFKSATIVTDQHGRALRARVTRRVEEEGWYWIESRVRRAVLVDEALFIDLLADVSGYDLQ